MTSLWRQDSSELPTSTLSTHRRSRFTLWCKQAVFAGLLLIVGVNVALVGFVYLPQMQHKSSIADNDLHMNQCNMESCFDFTKCRAKVLQVYIYPREAGIGKYISQLQIKEYEKQQNRFELEIVTPLKRMKSIEITTDPQKACLFLVRGMCYAGNRCDTWEGFLYHRLRALPYWNNGRNHVIFDQEDSSAPKFKADDAIFVRTSSHHAFYRPGYDVQMVLRGKVDFEKLAATQAKTMPFLKRGILMSFKGSRTHVIRSKFEHLHNGKDVIILLRDKNQIASVEYKNTDYKDLLLHTKFALTPRGLGVHAHRLMESMSAGCIPVIVSDGYVLPFADIFDWRSMSFQFAASEIDQIVPFLSKLPDEVVEKMHQNVIKAYPYFKKRTKLASGISIIRQRLENRRYYPLDFNQHVPGESILEDLDL